MKRFDRLEFQEPQVTQPEIQQTTRAADRDEHHWMAQALEERRNGQHETALRLYSRALEMDKSLVGGWVGQVQMLIALGEDPEADLWSRKALELFKNNADLLAARAQALCRTGDLRAAQASCDAAIGQPGMGSYPWTSRGELMLARKENLDDSCFDKAIQLDRDWLVPLEIASIYLHYDRPTKALRRVRQAVEGAPDRGYCWYMQGTCELALGMGGPAKQSFTRCLQLEPKNSEARQQLIAASSGGGAVRGFFRRMFGRA